MQGLLDQAREMNEFRPACVCEHTSRTLRGVYFHKTEIA
jgi:hypothetical protein